MEQWLISNFQTEKDEEGINRVIWSGGYTSIPFLVSVFGDDELSFAEMKERAFTDGMIKMIETWEEELTQ